MTSQKTNSPFISIIITVLNGAKTLQTCLDSIQDQTFSEYELVLIDGGSTDGSDQIAINSKIRDKTVRIVPELGLYAGLNLGIRLSTGKWLYFIGADDRLHNFETLQEVSKSILAKHEDARVMVGSVNFLKQKIFFQPILGSPFFLRHSVHHQGMFYDRTVFNKSMYDESMRIASDYEFNMKLALMGVPHQLMNVVVCDFGGDGVSENQLKKGFLEMQQSHVRLFKGLNRVWVMQLFWLRRRVGALLRHFELREIRLELKRIFG